MKESDVQTETDRETGNEEKAGKYLTFHLGEEVYGLDIRPIDDIIEMTSITEVPQTPDYLNGVINLRGSVVPVIDLRTRFDMGEREFDRETCIVVVTLEDFQTGLIVDRVSEVVDFKPGQIDASPTMGHRIETRYLAGIGKLDGTVVMLLDLDAILEPEETEELRELQEESE